MAALLVFGIREVKRHNLAEISFEENTSNRVNILLHCTPSDYFLYKGTPVGFQYELLCIMCDSLGLTPVFTYSTDASEAKQGISSGKYDIMAVDLDSEMADTMCVDYSVAHSFSFPVLICRDGDVEGYQKILYLPAHFPGQLLMNTLGDAADWELVQSSDMCVDEFLGLLRNKKINYLVSDYHTVLALLPSYPELTISARIGPEYQRRWALNPANDSLNQKINEWLARYKSTPAYKSLCNKYFLPRTKYLLSGASDRRSGRISSYDAIIKKYARARNLDWRFVSSIIFQESRFQTGSTGAGGSFGIMQMMPTTGEAFGVDSTSSIQSQLYAGICLIASIDREFKDIEDANERMFFVAASYNAGSGHIHDARKLCRKYGGNPDVWLDVEPYLALKSDRKFYSDPVVRSGYYPGKHTIRYTHNVMNRYHAYVIYMPPR